jgi:transposase-like protein
MKLTFASGRTFTEMLAHHTGCLANKLSEFNDPLLKAQRLEQKAKDLRNAATKPQAPKPAPKKPTKAPTVEVNPELLKAQKELSQLRAELAAAKKAKQLALKDKVSKATRQRVV